MASVQAKIVWKRQRRRENKNYSFVSSLPGAKFKNNIMAPLKEDEKGGQEKLSFRSVPTQRRIENA